MTRIIGLAGRAGSGKSTCADWLRDNHGASVYSLALPLKFLAQDVFGFTAEQVFGTQAQKEAADPRWGMSPREALIRLGNSARERLGEDVWLNACLNLIRFESPRLAVIADVRYPNEAHAVARAGGIVVRLDCPDAATSVDPNAPSERSVDQIDPADVSVEIRASRSPGAADLLSTFASMIRGYLT